MERPACITCPHWSCDRDARPFKGDCRVNAPVAVIAPLPDGYNVLSLWPVTSPFVGCGEHPDFPAYLESRKPKKIVYADGPGIYDALPSRVANIVVSETHKEGDPEWDNPPVEVIRERLAKISERTMQQWKGFGEVSLFRVRRFLGRD